MSNIGTISVYLEAPVCSVMSSLVILYELGQFYYHVHVHVYKLDQPKVGEQDLHVSYVALWSLLATEWAL